MHYLDQSESQYTALGRAAISLGQIAISLAQADNASDQSRHSQHLTLELERINYLIKERYALVDNVDWLIQPMLASIALKFLRELDITISE